MAEGLNKKPPTGPFHAGEGKIRRERMAVLALADTAILEKAAADVLPFISYTFLRRPEAGLVMLEGRAGNSGRRFNLGEMLITRCVITLENAASGSATEGYAFIQGNRSRHAELAALFDALLQQEQYAARLEMALMIPLRTKRDAALKERVARTASTRVDFFTLVRGEDE